MLLFVVASIKYLILQKLTSVDTDEKARQGMCSYHFTIQKDLWERL